MYSLYIYIYIPCLLRIIINSHRYRPRALVPLAPQRLLLLLPPLQSALLLLLLLSPLRPVVRIIDQFSRVPTKIPLPAKDPWPVAVQLHGSIMHMECAQRRHMARIEASRFVGSSTPICSVAKPNDLCRAHLVLLKCFFVPAVDEHIEDDFRRDAARLHSKEKLSGV